MISYERGSDQKFFLKFLNFLLCSKRCFKVYRVFATSTLSDIVSSFFSKVVFFLDLFFSERNGFTVWQNFLLSVIFFSFSFAKYCFFSFLKRDTRKFLSYLFSYVGFFKNLFLKRVLSMQAFIQALILMSVFD